MFDRTLLFFAFTSTLSACAPSTKPGQDTGGTGDDAGVDGGADGSDGGDDGGTPSTGYAFTSRFDGESSVSYSGQTMRHLLIEDLKSWIGGLTARIDGGWFPVPGEVEGELHFYYAFDSATSGSVPHAKQTDPAALQVSYDDVATGKDLVSKVAGNDAEGQHEDWSTALIGWGPRGSHSPDGLARAWMAQIDANAVARSNGDIPRDPTGAPITAVYLTPEGHDLQQLLQKFLTGAITYSQGADDYLDDDLADHGLNADHTAPEEGANYTALEHAWDEGFGYFGAARDYGDWDDALTAETPWRDTWQADGAIDLLTEASWGHSVNAGKRDDGAISPTDLSGAAWTHFLEGRRLLARTEGPLNDADRAALLAHRDGALAAWDTAIAATVVHYINDVLRDMGTFGTSSYVFADHAKHWSEMKGFALSLQFSPHTALSDDELLALHGLLGDAPVLPNADADAIAAYAAALIDARARIGAAYAFDSSNLGDDWGNNGW